MTFFSSFGILGDEQDLQLGEQRVAPGDERLQLLPGELAHVGIARARELLGLRDVVQHRLVLAELRTSGSTSASALACFRYSDESLCTSVVPSRRIRSS